MPTPATTVEEYLAALPDDRRATVEAVRAVIRQNLDPTYREGIQYGMIAWYVPHEVYPAGYHVNPKQALQFAALAAQKNYVSLYLMGVYDGPGNAPDAPTDLGTWFREAWAATGRRLDMGKSCVRLRRLEDVQLDVIGELIRRLPAKEFIARYEAGRRATGA